MAFKIQHGKTLKNTEVLTISFNQRFNNIPDVVVTPMWRGGVEAVETISSVTHEGFVLEAQNAADDYYISWIAISDE